MLGEKLDHKKEHHSSDPMEEPSHGDVQITLPENHSNEESPRSSTTPVISVEEYEDNFHSSHEDGSPDENDNDERATLLQVPEFNPHANLDPSNLKDQVIRRFSTGSQLDRSAKKKVMKRRDTPPMSDPIFKLHLSPRGSRKVIKPFVNTLDSLCESKTLDTPGDKCVPKGLGMDLECGQITSGHSKRTVVTWERCNKRGELSMLEPTREHMKFIENALKSSPVSTMLIKDKEQLPQHSVLDHDIDHAMIEGLSDEGHLSANSNSYSCGHLKSSGKVINQMRQHMNNHDLFS